MKTLAFFFVLISPVFARIGESVIECRARYGNEVEVEEKSSTMAFIKAGFMVVVAFDQGRAAMLHVSHTGKSELGKPADITDAELQTFMEANGGGTDWIERNDFDFINRTWDTKDGKKIAIYNTLEHSLVFVTAEFAKKSASKKSDEEKKNLNGF